MDLSEREKKAVIDGAEILGLLQQTGWFLGVMRGLFWEGIRKRERKRGSRANKMSRILSGLP